MFIHYIYLYISSPILCMMRISQINRKTLNVLRFIWPMHITHKISFHMNISQINHKTSCFSQPQGGMYTVHTLLWFVMVWYQSISSITFTVILLLHLANHAMALIPPPGYWMILLHTPDIARLMGPIWGRQNPGGPHVGPVHFAIWDTIGIYWGLSIKQTRKGQSTTIYTHLIG